MESCWPKHLLSSAKHPCFIKLYYWTNMNGEVGVDLFIHSAEHIQDCLSHMLSFKPPPVIKWQAYRFLVHNQDCSLSAVALFPSLHDGTDSRHAAAQRSAPHGAQALAIFGKGSVDVISFIMLLQQTSIHAAPHYHSSMEAIAQNRLSTTHIPLLKSLQNVTLKYINKHFDKQNAGVVLHSTRRFKCHSLYPLSKFIPSSAIPSTFDLV